MATELTVTAAGGSLTATLTGAWELQAGSQDTGEWLDGGGTGSDAYPGGLTAFQPRQSDGTTGYDPAPKMAIIALAVAANTNTITLSGGATSILGTFVSNQDTVVAQGIGASHSGLVVSLITDGAVAAAQLLVFYN